MDQEEADYPVVRQFPDDEEGEGGNDVANGSPASRPDRPPSEVAGDDDEDEGDSESGEDIMKKNGNIVGSDDEDDSSEEEEDDPEEARRIAEGFIVDEEDEEDAENEDDSDDEKKRKRISRRAKRKRREKEIKEQEDEQLDEDDLDLVAENTGVKRKERRLKRFRRGSASPDGRNEAPKKQKDLQHIFSDDEDDPITSRRPGYYDDEEDGEEDLPSAGQALRLAADRRNRKEAAAPIGFEDEMEDFIDDDESDMEGDMSEGEREARREEKREQRKADVAARRAKGAGVGGFDPGRAGIDAEAWAELNDVFGDGSEYAFALKIDDDEDDDEANEEDRLSRKKRADFKDIFEPAAIKARMMTDEDDRIKRADFPERFQAALPGEEGLQLLERVLTSEELDECSRWVSRRFSYRSNRLFLHEDGQHAMYREAWFKCVRTMVELIINQRREPMYLFTHRADEHELRISEEGVLELLQRRDFSALVSSCLKFKTLLHRRDTLRATFAKLFDQGSGSAPTSEDSIVFEEMLKKTESTDEVADVTEWLVMKFGQKIRDIQAAQQDTLLSATTFKRPTVIGTYERLKSTKAFPLAARFGINSVMLAENVTSRSQSHFAEDETVTPTVLADQFVDLVNGPTSIEVALESARTILAHEIGKNPTLKREAKMLFKEAGQISVEPTERGHYKIDEENPYYNFKFLKNKPVSQFNLVVTDGTLIPPAQYLMILRAEEELLIDVRIDLQPEKAMAFENRLYDAYASESTSESSKLWNQERKIIVEQAIKSFLYPAATLWVREWLREECWEWIGRACEISLTKRIDCQPYQSSSMRRKKELEQQRDLLPYGKDYDSDDEDDEEDEIDKRDGLPKVLAVSHGDGDMRTSHVETIFLDAGGRFRQRNEFETIELPQILDPMEASEEDLKPHPARDFIQLLVNRRPDVIVINGFSPRTVTLKKQVLECVEKAINMIVEKKEIPSEEEEQRRIARELAQIDVIYCHDDVARLYQHSARAAEEFSSLTTLGRYCVGLARYVQSPVQEFAALSEEDLLALRYDTYQQLIPRDRLLNFLERAMVAVVNMIGVDINRAVVNAYYANLLRYVSGLGLRKADALMRAVTSQLGSFVVNRDSLLIGAADSGMISRNIEILSNNVWHNACSFLVIRSGKTGKGSSTVRKVKMQGQFDILDSTRIHPEAYEYARFIAFDALRKTEEDREDNQHASAWCAELMDDPGRKLKVEDIDMADYERNLWVQQSERGEKRERKLSLLEFIARELMEPLAELRNDFMVPSPDEVLTMLTGETKATFDTQRLVNVQVRRITPEYITVTLASGIEGTIHAEYLRPMSTSDYQAIGQKPKHIRDIVKRDQTIKAQIIDIDVENIRAELTARESHLEEAKEMDAERRRVPVDAVYFDKIRAEMERERSEMRRLKKQKANRGARYIRHPDFHNFKAGQAEEYLANMPRGTAIVRPSSKGSDHLAVTWKVFDGVYQHIDVLELDKENEHELGRILRIGDGAGSSYSDLDELLVNHIAPMARMVEMLTLHEKFRGSDESLQTYLANSSLANPGKSQYGFAIDKKRPGVFILGFKANRGAEVQRWPVRVLPGRFKLNEAELPDVVSLCNAFKTQYTTRLMTAARAGDKTPGGALGAMTPGGILRMGGGITPGIMRTGGGGVTPMAARTPAVYGHGMVQQSINSLATPNPYLFQQQQQRPPPPGAPPVRPGPPPSRPPQLGSYGNGVLPTQQQQQQQQHTQSAPAGIHPDRLAQMGNSYAPSGWD
ncbi:hypothetical protein CBS101457_004055 [Exobasidium rhododendri]|nr:hypothetical protein CBS101457_004055 [Exobasidium rhododendri]